MEYLRAFLCGGVLCAIGQILIDKTRLTPARILTGYVVGGVVLTAVIVSVSCFLTGLVLSLWLDTAVGASVILMNLLK